MNFLLGINSQSSAPPVDPILALGPLLYIKPGDSDSFLNASAEPASNGEAVATILDSSGNGNNLTQTTGGLRGIWDAVSAPSGVGAVTFDGLSGQRYSIPLSPSQPYTIHTVVARDSAVDVYMRLINAGDRGNLDYLQSDNKLQMYAGTAVSGVIASGIGDWCVFTVIFNGSSSLILENGALVASGNCGSDANPTTFLLGASAIADKPFNGRCAGMVIFMGAQDSGNISTVVSFLATLTGIVLP